MQPAPRPAAPATAPASERPLLRRLLGDRPDETVLRGVFRGLLVLSVVVVGWDLHERSQAAPGPALTPGDREVSEPNLPSARPGVSPEDRPGGSPAAALRAPMTLELVSAGRLEARGTITPGTAERLEEELAKRGDYVRTIVLDSPGGSVGDALRMGRLVRDRRIDTLVEPGGLCASSCPLVFAGGVHRIAAADAAIGVHQVFAAQWSGGAAGPAEGMEEAQRVSAECQRHLVSMGVDPRVWISAMETPPRSMFYFTPEELSEFSLSTDPPVTARSSP